jgi:hypothetical protein
MSSTKELRAKCYYQFQKFFQLVLRVQHPKCWKSFTAWAKMMLMFTSKKKADVVAPLHCFFSSYA